MRSGKAASKAAAPSGGGNALVTFDAQLAKQQEKKELEKHRGANQYVAEYTGPKVKWEDTGLYKAMVKSKDIEEELTKIRNLIRKRTDPGYEPDDDDFKVAPTRAFNAKTDYYKLLDVEDFATAKDIKGAYKKMALLYHPDKNRDKKPDELRAMQDEFEKIQEAYEVLSDRATRRQYDRAKFDEARAKSQGMGSSIYSQKTNTDSNFWGRWSARREANGQNGAAGAKMPAGKTAKLPKAPDLVVVIKISLEKALRGGMKIRDVNRDRMQRAFGSTSKTAKVVHVKIEPGQADGSEYRLEGDGHWPSFNVTPGDLVFKFEHKQHPNLRQIGTPGEGHLEVAKPLLANAASGKTKSIRPVLAVWTPTFKGQMVLMRFRNPLLSLAPAKSCKVVVKIPGEGLPVFGDSANRRGSLSLHVEVKSDGEVMMPTFGEVTCKSVLMRRFTRVYNHVPVVRTTLSLSSGFGTDVRVYSNEGSADRSADVPGVSLTVWEAPNLDPVIFAKAAAALGSHAARDAAHFVWQYHRALTLPRLLPTGHVHLADDELLSDEEEEEEEEEECPNKAASKRDRSSDGIANNDNNDHHCHGSHGGEAFDFDALEKETAQPAVPSTPAERKRLEKEQFLTRFNLGPPDGFGPASDTKLNEEFGNSQPSRLPSKKASTEAPKTGPSPVALSSAEQESPEEKELTRLIRQKQSEIDQAKRKWSNRRQRLQGERQEEESTLRELLEKDKKREYDRIEKEMNGLRSNFEYQVNAEKKWMDEFKRDSKHRNEWICVFKPAMVARTKPQDGAPVVRRILLDEVVKAKGEVTEDHWIQLDGQRDTTWALTWHAKHGRLLQQWYGPDQSKFIELQKKIDDRRANRNQTFVDYRKKRKEVEEWGIPPGPTQEELYEIEDEEGEQLMGLVDPLLKELKEYKRRLRELRQKRLEQALELARREAAGGSVLGVGELPQGFQLQEESGTLPDSNRDKNDAINIDTNGRNVAPPAVTTATEFAQWQETKAQADKAFKGKDWHTASSLYSKALGEMGELTATLNRATLLSNRALVKAKLDDWKGSLEDSTMATQVEASWSKGWIRRATAALRLNKDREALDSLLFGMGCENAPLSQFLPLVTECEAALYSDQDPEAPASAKERLEVFKSKGTSTFQQGKFGDAIFWYTRSLYHRSMMEGNEEALVLSNRAAAFLKRSLASEALADALSASERDPRWAKPLVRAAQASLLLSDFKSAYQHYAKARMLDEHYPMALDGLNECLQKMVQWEYPAAAKRWARFSTDRKRPRENTRIWALSDVFFDQYGVPEWCKSLSSTFFRDDILLLAGNLADSLPQLRFALTVLKSKFRRIFYVPGNHDLWVRKVTLQTIIKGENIKDEQRSMIDSVSKFLEVLQVCDEMGVETAPAEVAAGVFIAPMFSWYSRDFVTREQRKEKASAVDAETRVTIDQWIRWPFPCGSDDAWKFFMRMNERPLRAVLAAKNSFERFTDEKAVVISMTHFLPRSDLDIDWTIPGIWDYIGCEGLDEHLRAVDSKLHVYGRACIGHVSHELDDVTYIHNYIGSTEKHRPGMAPHCVFDRGVLAPPRQPVQEKGFNYQPMKKPEEPPVHSGFGGG